MHLQTARLHLRDFVPDDWRAVLAYQSDPRYQRFYAESEHTEESTRRFVQMFLDSQTETPRRYFQLAVTLPDGILIGNCGVRRLPDSETEAETGYELNPNYWGKGYATEAARALRDYGFRELGIHRLSSWCYADNTASAHVLEKLGLRLEGRRREVEFFRGRWWDVLEFGLLEEEWRERVKSEE